MTSRASRYNVLLKVDVENGMAEMFLDLLDEHQVLLATYDDKWTTFCWTWKDLVEYIERRYVAAGGDVNGSLLSPSPYVDLS
jgi:hypothetical protein